MMGRERRGASNHSARSGARRVTRLLALLALAAPLATAATAAPAEDAPTLLGKYKCYICHADRETKAGPAYVDVAAHYRGKRNAVTLLAREIRRGLKGGSPWHMPPHPEVSPAQAQTIARYIMSLTP